MSENKSTDSKGAAAATAVKLEKPIVSTFLGSVVGLTSRPAGGKFKHPTKIVTLSNVQTGQTVDVFITEAQWREYGCANYIYSGNVVAMSVEECIEGKTGYFETADADVMTPHEATFSAFNRALNADSILLMTTLSKEGVEASIIGLIISNMTSVRNAHERAGQSAIGGGMPQFN